MPGLEVRTKSENGGYSHDGGSGPYEGYSSNWNSYDGCEVRYLRDKEGVHGDIGYATRQVDVTFDVKPGDVVYVVVAVFTTGGTFGEDSGLTEVVRVYEDFDKAERLVAFLWDDYKNKPRTYGEVDFEGDPIYTGTWKGYFESLDDIHLEKEIVRA